MGGMGIHNFFQRSLFGDLAIPSQADVIATLEPHFLHLWHTIADPWCEFQQYRETDRNFQDFTEEETAQWLTIQATHRARGFFDTDLNVRPATRYRKLILIVNDKLAVTIKKLTRRRRPGGQDELTRSNYLTRANVNYWSQRRVEPQFDYPRVILGYQLLNEITEIKILIAFPRTQRRGVQWAYEIPPQAPLVQTTLSRLEIVEQNDSQKGFVIEPAAEIEQPKAQ
jgi:hypothetical protein